MYICMYLNIQFLYSNQLFGFASYFVLLEYTASTIFFQYSADTELLYNRINLGMKT